MKPMIYAPVLGLAILAACDTLRGPTTTERPAFVAYGAGGDSISVAATLDEFRAALGGALNAPNTAPAASGRREINWDGAPALLTNVDTFPAKFFNVNSQRGVVFGTPGTGLRVDSTNFAAVEPGLGAQLRFFSAKKVFMPVGSNQLDVDFLLVGTTTSGLVNGFGVVFSDVDRAGSTTVEFLDANGDRLALLAAPAQPGAQLLSFIGAVFETPIVARVRIVSGDAAVVARIADVSAGGANDIVVMDDFVYGEPQPLR